MNETITIDGNEYEVLTSWEEATHAQLATGAKKTQITAFGLFIDSSLYTMKQVNDNNIQPLKLVERVPVEVIGKFTGVEVYADYEVAKFMVPLGTGQLIGRKMDMKLTQITEEA